jgi:hypothetical protein
MKKLVLSAILILSFNLGIIAQSNWPDTFKISVMGSSVPTGYCAAGRHGYIHMYNDLLRRRDSLGLSQNAWHISNISVPGDNTIKLLKRYGDLVKDNAPYVIFALSLGNEGIHKAKDQKAVFDQWERNMKTLIAKARAEGKYVIVTNNYTRGDFDSSDYYYVKRMNLRVQQWNCPSVNLLGAIDDGAGHWAEGYGAYKDVYHPNTAGHRELFHSMVPSMFDAIKEGKPIPIRHEGKSIRLGKKQYLEIVPEDTVHSFTISYNVKNKRYPTVYSVAGLASLSIDKYGNGFYHTQDGGVIQLKDQSNDGKWHRITLTHYYARGETLIYIDKNLQCVAKERLDVHSILFMCSFSRIGDLFFYRSGMNSDEISALCDGAMLKSSLEIYSPLGSLRNIRNLAQSKNLILINDY